MGGDLCVYALKEAVGQGNPKVFETDQAFALSRR